MPPKKVQFEFVENPEKTLAPSTLAAYKRYLNLLANQGFKNKEELLMNPSAVVDYIKSVKSKGQRNFLYGAVFYSTGRLDVESDGPGKILYKGFQENYKS